MPRIPPAVARWVFPVAFALLLISLAIWRGALRLRPSTPNLPHVPVDCLRGQARLLPLPAAKRALAPLAATWEMPMGTRGGAGIYNAQPFGSPNPARGGMHLGDDLNGIGQENSDRGDPVFAVADGLVVFSGVPSPGWGGVIILLHRAPEGEKQTFYGHLEANSLAVVAGEVVPRGRRLGRIGLPEAVDFAHLHLELRSGAVISPGAGYSAMGPGDSENATQFLESRRGVPGLPVAAMAGRWAGGVHVGGPAGVPE